MSKALASTRLSVRCGRMAEQIGQLSVDLGVTRMDLLKARVAVGEAVKSVEVDPMSGQLNDLLAEARTKLEASQAAADDTWITLQTSSDDALDTIGTGTDGAWSSLDAADS